MDPTHQEERNKRARSRRWQNISEQDDQQLDVDQASNQMQQMSVSQTRPSRPLPPPLSPISRASLSPIPYDSPLAVLFERKFSSDSESDVESDHPMPIALYDDLPIDISDSSDDDLVLIENKSIDCEEVTRPDEEKDNSEKQTQSENVPAQINDPNTVQRPIVNEHYDEDLIKSLAENVCWEINISYQLNCI